MQGSHRGKRQKGQLASVSPVRFLIGSHSHILRNLSTHAVQADSVHPLTTGEENERNRTTQKQPHPKLKGGGGEDRRSELPGPIASCITPYNQSEFPMFATSEYRKCLMALTNPLLFSFSFFLFSVMVGNLVHKSPSLRYRGRTVGQSAESAVPA
jgi:hypothetical protein